ncbi:hypothetical protein [Anabaena sp. CS-542/02]|uniref:hypothetical protein n=1 Tax=Anabaena sp. CS-542/02 TaxID=3021719 RepID=UPI00232EFC82|nr:hypothetical protein [Anabaena sp. CS-542/02]
MITAYLQMPESRMATSGIALRIFFDYLYIGQMISMTDTLFLYSWLPGVTPL